MNPALIDKAFHDQKARVDALRALITEYKDAIYEAENQLRTHTPLLEDLCAQRGHDYIQERDDDYHRSSYTYTCQKCHHFTRFKPATFRTQ